MSSSKDIRRYTEKWLDLFDWFESHPQEDKVVVTPSESRAKSMRLEFYKAREAARNDAELRKAYRNMERREVTLDGPNVLFRFKENTSAAVLLDAALHGPGSDERKEVGQ